MQFLPFYLHIYHPIYIIHPLTFILFSLYSFSSALLQLLAWIIHLQCSPSSAPRHNTITFSTSQPSPKFVENDIEKYPRCSGCINELKAHGVGMTEIRSLTFTIASLSNASVSWLCCLGCDYGLVSFKQTDSLSYFLHKLLNFVANHAKKWPAAT